MSPQEPLPDVAPERTAAVQALADRLSSKSHIYHVFLSSMTLTRVCRGTVVSQLLLEPMHANSRGGIHGAVSATIIDFVTGLAIASWDLRESTGVSVDMHISYLSTARAGDTVEVEARAERVGGNLAVVTIRIAKVEADGGRTLVTLGTHTKQSFTYKIMAEDTPQPRINVSAAEARRLVHEILTGNGVPSPNAHIIAGCLVAADLRGVDTHGMNRIPSYMERIRQNVLDPAAEPAVTHVTPVVAHVDGHNGFGFVAAHRGMAAAVEAAKVYGIGMASVKHSNHFGMSAWAVQQALDADMMSLVFTNSSPALPAWGGREKLMGVSPIACGAPGKDASSDFILDMAPSVAARGKIYKAKRRGEKIPLDWALDSEGRPTDDPEAALGGVMLPMGGPKGSALSIMMDVFSGVLSGSAYAGHVTNPYDPSRPADVGHFLVAIKPDLFMSLDEFRGRMQYLYERVVGSQKMAGVDRIYFPGEIEQITQREREVKGIPLVQAEIDALNEEASRVSARPLQTM
ncbi:hypothetical protein S40285_09130 [Stachybotrys chlorohalonatus IBT 40285]|uniref:Thioesterase domain-containing protein n=1 Tax=Stachybotrys chlorohalonatus (strain IBT 40285) TaxID=1283841 RepID=A0A084Q7X5_STAC4|nr:hypothetical protein S40285_09130 [Stachybotrys chlorohalonata IBT 40285]